MFFTAPRLHAVFSSTQLRLKESNKLNDFEMIYGMLLLKINIHVS